MALNKGVLKTRALTALAFTIVMVGGLVVHPYLFFILLTIIHFGAWYEYVKLLGHIHQVPYNTLTVTGCSCIGYNALLVATSKIVGLGELRLLQNFALVFTVVGFVLLAYSIIKSEKVVLAYYLKLLVGIGYISVSLALLLYCSSSSFYSTSINNSWYNTYCTWPSFILLCMWLNDTFAYLVGSVIGKTPLSTISPKKTWEGTIGGIIISSVIMGLWYSSCSGSTICHISTLGWVAIAVIATVLGCIGDLLESKLKRLAGVKDSGTFMPGHGGFLDRFDSLLFAAPFVVIIVSLIT